MQPGTSYYSFLSGNANIDIIPKLLQITMVSGLFQAGETVSGYINDKKVTSFRIANSSSSLRVTYLYGLKKRGAETFLLVVWSSIEVRSKDMSMCDT